MSAGLTIADSVAEIRAAIGAVALLQAGGELEMRDVANAVTIIDQELVALEQLAAGAPQSCDLPVLTLAEVAARARFRDFVARPPRLRAIQGGKP